jgi:hypothetical protein
MPISGIKLALVRSRLTSAFHRVLLLGQHRFTKQKTILMRKMLAPLFAVVLCLFGCVNTEPTQYYNRTKVVNLAPLWPRKQFGNVKLYQSKDEVQGAYYVAAIMSVEGRAGDEAAFIKAFLYRAADLGADGLILYRVSYAAGISGGGFVAGKDGGVGMPVNPSQDAVYRGEAINFGAQPTNSVVNSRH